jgi:3-oxoacyl-[acyl-carrier protein] reductase
VDLGLAERVAVVAGGDSPTQWAIARLLLEEGARVVLACGADQSADVAQKELDPTGSGRLETIAVELTATDAADAVDRALERFGRVDFVAVVAPQWALITIDAVEDPKVLTQAWEAVVGAVRLYQQAALPMRSQGWGRFVYVCTSGVKALCGRDDDLDVMDGLGMLALHKVVANELGPFGITANAVLRGGSASVDDVASTVAFLSSDLGGFLNGVAITADGGAGCAVF